MQQPAVFVHNAKKTYRRVFATFYDLSPQVTELDREKERLMLEAKNKISLATQQQNMVNPVCDRNVDDDQIT